MKYSPQALFFICELYFTTLKKLYFAIFKIAHTLEVFFLSLTTFKIALILYSRIYSAFDSRRETTRTRREVCLNLRTLKSQGFQCVL